MKKFIERSLEATSGYFKPVAKVYESRGLHLEPENTEYDTQELAIKAGLIIDSDASRAIFAGIVMVELEAGRITPSQANFYLTDPSER